MILAKEFEGELWVKAADHNREVNRLIAAEREACAALCFQMWNDSLDRKNSTILTQKIVPQLFEQEGCTNKIK